jgi:hypothetical protein
LDPLSSVQAIVANLQSAALLARNIDEAGELLELSIARGEFARALGRTRAWTELAAGHVSPAEWLQANRIDAAWTREWLGRVSRCAAVDATFYAIERVLVEAGVVPAPDFVEVMSTIAHRCDVFFKWMGDEPPPDPMSESKADFLARMSNAWDVRVRLVGGRPGNRRNLAAHAAWFVRHRIDGEAVSTILQDYPDYDVSTVNKALKTFPDFIEVPR